VLRQEVHLGPPGYGESPSEDRRDTIIVIVPPRPVPVCPGPDSATRTMLRVADLQLLNVPHSILAASGREVTAYGTLEEATWGWHYTPILLRVDSIPVLRLPRPSRQVMRRDGHVVARGPVPVTRPGAPLHSLQ
jgi:hypothetical protein